MVNGKIVCGENIQNSFYRELHMMEENNKGLEKKMLKDRNITFI